MNEKDLEKFINKITLSIDNSTISQNIFSSLHCFMYCIYLIVCVRGSNFDSMTEQAPQEPCPQAFLLPVRPTDWLSNKRKNCLLHLHFY